MSQNAMVVALQNDIVSEKNAAREAPLVCPSEGAGGGEWGVVVTPDILPSVWG